MLASELRRVTTIKLAYGNLIIDLEFPVAMRCDKKSHFVRL